MLWTAASTLCTKNMTMADMKCFDMPPGNKLWQWCNMKCFDMAQAKNVAMADTSPLQNAGSSVIVLQGQM